MKSEQAHSGTDSGVPGCLEPDDEAVRGKEQNLGCPGVLASDPVLHRGLLGVGTRNALSTRMSLTQEIHMGTHHDGEQGVVRPGSPEVSLRHTTSPLV